MAMSAANTANIRNPAPTHGSQHRKPRPQLPDKNYFNPIIEVRFLQAYRLLQLHRAGVQLVVLALLRDQLVMRTTLDDVAMVEHHDHIGIAHGGQAVGDDEDRTALHQVIHTSLHNLFSTRINRGRGLVKDPVSYTHLTLPTKLEV